MRDQRGLDWLPQEYVLADTPGLFTGAYGELSRAFSPHQHQLRHPSGRWARPGDGGAHRVDATSGQAPTVTEVADRLDRLAGRLAAHEAAGHLHAPAGFGQVDLGGGGGG
jgi:hypothetical protein